MSWPMVKLGDLVTIKGGGTPSKSDSSFWEGDIPWASVKDLKGSRISETEDSISDLGVKSSATNIIPAGTIITATRMALGRFAINTVDMAINQDLKALFVKDKNELSRDYLFRFLESKAQYIQGEGKGATVKGITLDFLKSIDVPLPPLAEQKRIAAILDKADAIRLKRQQAIQLADDFLRAVFLEMFGDPLTNPKGWEVKTFSELVENKDGKRVPIKSSDRRLMSGDFPYYGASGVIDFVNDFIFEGRNLLIGEDGANLLARSTPVAFIADGKYWVNNHAHVLGEKTVKLEYLQYTINLRTLEPYISGSAQPKLNQANLNSIPIPVPPTALSNKFAQIVTETLNLISKMNDFGGFRNFEALSQKAFTGQL